MSDAIAEALTRHALTLAYEALPAAAVESGRAFFADTIGVGIAGAGAPLSAEVLGAAAGWGGPLDRGALVLGRNLRLPAASAAYVNAFQIHCQEFDCVHEAAVVHPMATILPALMATADAREQLTGGEFMAALLAAVDVATGLGVAATSPLQFFRPATAGLFGATLGVARLRGLDAASARNALGIALAHCSGTMQAHIEGKPTLALQAANASRAAVMACDLAAAGVAGPWDVFSGQFGYFALFEKDSDLQRALEGLGERFRICEVSHKTHPTGRAAQGGLAGVARAAAIAAQRGFTIKDIESATLSAPPIIRRLVGRPYRDAMSVNYARLCFSYLAATQLLRGAVDFHSFEAACLADAEIRSLAERISVTVNEVVDESAFAPQTFSLRFGQGAVIETSVTHQPGSPADPLSADAQKNKFRACLAFGLGNLDQLDIDATWEALFAFDRRSFNDTQNVIGQLCRIKTSAGTDSAG